MINNIFFGHQYYLFQSTKELHLNFHLVYIPQYENAVFLGTNWISRLCLASRVEVWYLGDNLDMSLSKWGLSSNSSSLMAAFEPVEDILAINDSFINWIIHFLAGFLNLFFTLPGWSQSRFLASPSSSPCPHSGYVSLFWFVWIFWMCSAIIFHFSCITSPSPLGVEAAVQYIWLEMDWRQGPTSSQSFLLASLSIFLHKPMQWIKVEWKWTAIKQTSTLNMWHVWPD